MCSVTIILHEVLPNKSYFKPLLPAVVWSVIWLGIACTIKTSGYFIAVAYVVVNIVLNLSHHFLCLVCHQHRFYKTFTNGYPQ